MFFLLGKPFTEKYSYAFINYSDFLYLDIQQPHGNAGGK